MTRTPTVPVDLDLYVKTVHINGKDGFEYTLHSPSGAVPFHHVKILGKSFARKPEDYWSGLLEQIERWNDGVDSDYKRLLAEEIREELENLGRTLYEELFPSEMRAAYRKIRDRVDTIRITSDEPFAPWELLKPFDDSDDDQAFEDDFLCLQYQLTRWLAGETIPSSSIEVSQLACFAVSESQAFAGLPKLPYTRQARDLFASLARERGVTDATP